MTAGNFDASLKAVLRQEGGNDDDPHDHGGRTSRGVTQREYDAYKARHNLAPSDVWSATKEEIEEIYYRQYWLPYCDELPDGINLFFFDYAVNAGRTQAVKDLQRALGVTVDGMMGLRTLQAVADCGNLPNLIKSYADRRRAFYRALKQFSRYGKGWLSRVNQIESEALAMCSKAPSEIVNDKRTPKANPADLDTAPVAPESGATISGGGAAAAGALSQINDQLSPYADTIKIVQYILIGVAIVGAGLTVWALIKAKRNQQVA